MFYSMPLGLRFFFFFWGNFVFRQKIVCLRIGCLLFRNKLSMVLYVGCVLREELVRESIQQGTKLVQAIADSLFSLTSTEDRDGPIVKLPPPVTRLPREKPVCCSFLLSHLLPFFLVIYGMFLHMHTASC